MTDLSRHAASDRTVAMTRKSWTVDQTSHRLLCAALRDTVQAGPGALEDAGNDGSIRYRASAVLYMLLLDHPIDQRGCCRSCRRSGEILGFRRRPCRILLRASYWLLHQLDDEQVPLFVAECSQHGTSR